MYIYLRHSYTYQRRYNIIYAIRYKRNNIDLSIDNTIGESNVWYLEEYINNLAHKYFFTQINCA